MYVDEDYNPQGDGGGLSFSVKINAYGKVKEAPTGSKIKSYITQADLENGNHPQTDFHADDYRSKITTITTKKDNIVPATAVESWDISEAGDGSVMAYVEETVADEDGNSTYKLTIGGKGGIIANESMVGYFDGFNNMTSIDLSVLDTSQVTNMMGMFYDCNKLTNLDVSNFDTSQVTNMMGMFSGCGSLTSLDVSKFDTSQVKSMYEMFCWCSSLTSLDVSNFDTSQVVNMFAMFYDCNKLTNLDVSNFDTSKVTNMGGMFCHCPVWDTIDQTKFADADGCPLE